jgi:DNA-binding SARP family transcriptional activator/tRNA A-37 threonylcarbamoyl transferase component Bud32/WD40 repeat protein
MIDGGVTRVELRVLGPVEARRDGATIALGGLQQRRLFGALLTEPGQSITIDRLVEILWTDSEPPDRARRTLMTYVSRLRLAIGVELVETIGAGYRLAVPTGSVDAVRFAELLDSASRSSPTHQLALLGEALALWRGPAFGELASEWWARPAASRLDELRLVAREDRAAALLLTGEPDVAISELEEMAATHPQRERTMVLYLRALSEAGRKVEALRAFHQYRDRLADETGLTPSESLVMLDRSIASDDAGAVTRAGQALRGYVLHELLGEGAASQVYRGTQPGIGRDVAIKVIKPELADTPLFVQRFEVEAQIVSRLEHPHIVPLYDFWREPGGAYLVFRWMRGGSADQVLARSGAWPLDRVTRLIVEVGGALVAAHASGVVHGDVKPANVLLDEADRHYLADFGIASEVDHDGNRAATADQFGLAATVWELLTGISPLAGVRRSGSVGYLPERTLPSLTPWRRELPATLDLVLRQATAVRGEDRFASLVDMIDAWVIASGSGVPRDERNRSTPTSAANPYKGLRPFIETDADDFYGRASLVDELVQRVASSSFVVVIGPSGSGKSSLLHAGLIPRLRAEAARVVTVTPGDDPSDRLRTGLLGVAISDHGDLPLVEQLRAVADEGESDVIVVVDEFEETWASADAGPRAEFLAAFAACPSNVRIVAAIRADHLDRPLCDQLAGPLVRDGAFLVTPLTGAELRQVISEPALSHRVLLEPGLAEQIVDDVAGARGALPMLQFALTELYRRQDNGVMTLAAYRSMGGVSGAITSRAEELLASFDESRQAVVRQLFERLVVPGDGGDDSCRPARRSEFEVDDEEVIEVLVAERLLIVDRDPITREPTVEVAHAALLTNWPRLRAWLDEDRDRILRRQRLGAAAFAWDSAGRLEADLYRGGRLVLAEEVVAGDGRRRVSSLEQSFIAASRELADAEARQRDRQHRRLRRRLAAIAVLLVVALGAGALAATQASRATTARDRAENEARQSNLRALLADVSALRTSDRDVAALLAVEAHRILPTAETASALFSLFTESSGFVGYHRLNMSSRIEAAQVMPDGSLVHATADGVLGRSDLAPASASSKNTAAQIIDSEALGSTLDLAASADGRLLARLIAAQEGSARLIVYDLAAGRRLVDARVDATSVAVSPTGRYVAAAGGTDGEVVVLDVDGTLIGRTDARINTSGRVLAATAAVTFAADGRMFVSSQDGKVHVVELPSMRQMAELAGKAGSIPPTTSLAVSADGATLFGNGFTDPSEVSAESASTVQAWDLESGKSLWSVADVRECVRIVLVPADKTLRCASFFGGLTAYSAATGEKVGAALDAQLGTVVELAVTAAGSMVAVSGVDPVVGEWRFDGSGPVTRQLGPATTPFAYLSPEHLMVLRLDRPGLPYLPPEVLDVRTGQIRDALSGFGPSTWAGPNRIASAFLDGTIGFYDIVSRQRTIADTPPRFPSPALAVYSPATKLLVVWHFDETNTTVDASGTWSSIDLPRVLPRSASFSSDGTRLLMIDASGLSMYEVKTGRRLVGPVEGVLEVGNSTNDLVATAGVDGTIEIRGLDDLQPVGAPVRLEGARVQHIEFDESGKVLVIRTTDAVHAIDVASRVVLGGPIPTGRPDPDEGLAVSPDGLEMALATTTRTAIWSLDPLDWEHAACRLAGRNLTRAEWQRYIGTLADYHSTCDEYIIDEVDAK